MLLLGGTTSYSRFHTPIPANDDDDVDDDDDDDDDDDGDNDVVGISQ